MNKIILSAFLIVASLMLAGCEQKGPAEQAGEKIDRGVENTKDTVSDAIEDAGDKIEDATDRY
ncbi:lipoprotein [uncultured Nitrosomonas sp.]|uniref:LptM family lipoprotein n=1 Tax=uncultured Nitrosomonas sp. TaxID=156424 RepID=UPI0025DBBB47|nr:lipoprotein [uncultured Nitrosomonas sp.]